MLQIEMIHHVSLPVTDLARARTFYSDVLELREVDRPPFDFPGAWYQIGGQQLHLIVGERSTFRQDSEIDSHDIHFAIRVRSYRGALAHFADRGYTTDARDPGKRVRENPTGRAGFPQLYLLDPDRNVIEINAERFD